MVDSICRLERSVSRQGGDLRRNPNRAARFRNYRMRASRSCFHDTGAQILQTASLHQLQASDGALAGWIVRRVFNRRIRIGVLAGVHIKKLTILTRFAIADLPAVGMILVNGFMKTRWCERINERVNER